MNEPFRINQYQCPPSAAQVVFAIGHAALLRPEKRFAMICHTDLGKKYLDLFERARDEFAVSAGIAWPDSIYVRLRNAIVYRDDVPKGELHVLEADWRGAPRDEDPLVVLYNIDADWNPLNRRRE